MSINLFTKLRADSELHPQFLKTRDDPQMGPARAVLQEIAATMHDPDGNLVEQFQTHGFDARTFEIYLSALFREAGHAIDRNHDRPDFLISRDGLTVAVEAVTANPPPSKDYQPYQLMPANPPQTMEEVFRYLKHEVAIKFGSPLYSKLRKRYWELPHVAGRPLIFAIETFHGGALQHSATSVSQYLFGVDHSYRFDDNGILIVEGEVIKEHVGSKTIPSNFFGQPDAQHVSAVLFCNADGPKFARIGQQGAHRSPAVRMIRYGTCLDHDPNAIEPEQFAYEVGDPEVPPEPWRDGSVLIHNPNALHPIPAEWLGAMAEENLQPSGTVALTWRDPFQPFESLTMMFPGKEREESMWRKVEEQMQLRSMGQEMVTKWRR